MPDDRGPTSHARDEGATRSSSPVARTGRRRLRCRSARSATEGTEIASELLQGRPRGTLFATGQRTARRRRSPVIRRYPGGNRHAIENCDASVSVERAPHEEVESMADLTIPATATTEFEHAPTRPKLDHDFGPKTA